MDVNTTGLATKAQVDCLKTIFLGAKLHKSIWDLGGSGTTDNSRYWFNGLEDLHDVFLRTTRWQVTAVSAEWWVITDFAYPFQTEA